jgi:hypothetical protein
VIALYTITSSAIVGYVPRVAAGVSLEPTMKAALDQLVRSPSAPQGLGQ